MAFSGVAWARAAGAKVDFITIEEFKSEKEEPGSEKFDDQKNDTKSKYSAASKMCRQAMQVEFYRFSYR